MIACPCSVRWMRGSQPRCTVLNVEVSQCRRDADSFCINTLVFVNLDYFEA